MYLPADYPLPAPSLYAAYPYDVRPSTAPSIGMGTGNRETMEPTPEMLARYRAQAELLSRAGVLPSGALAGLGSTGTIMPGMYNADNTTLARYGLAAQAGAWGQADGGSYAGPSEKDLQDYDGRSFPEGGGSAALSAHPPAHAAPYSAIPATAGHASGADAHAAAAAGFAAGVPFPHHRSSQDRRSEELSDDYGSDSGVSVPSSANSSSVHLPMGDSSQRRPYTAESQSPTAHYQNNARKDEDTGEGGFSSAFGLMSLDDPNVLAGLANDSAPFFSALQDSAFPNAEHDAHSASSSTTSLHSEVSNDDASQTSQTSGSSMASSAALGLSLPTPTPELIASLKNGGLLSAGGREALDSKELREFWKQYMRTPLTGPGANTPLFPLQTPTGPGQQLGAGMSSTMAGRPSPTRRHSRVASLPSMKTPPIIGGPSEFTSFAPIGNFSLSLGPKARERNQQLVNGTGNDIERGPPHQQVSYSNMRTTLHGDAEDLKSYEQAVLARKAPVTLNLVPRRRGTMPAGSSAPSKTTNMSPPQLPASTTATTSGVVSLSQATNPNVVPSIVSQGHSGSNSKIGDLNHERPGSSSSSLVDAFGSPSSQHQQAAQQSPRDGIDHRFIGQDQYRMHSQSSESPRESSVGTESDSATSPSYRPSFKRLASQTLGPANAKRALLGPAGWDDVRREDSEAFDDEDDRDGDEHVSRRIAGRGAFSQNHPARRFSLPATAAGTASVTLPPIRSTAVGSGHDLAQSQPPVGVYPPA
jgi:hypothetical protein